MAYLQRRRRILVSGRDTPAPNFSTYAHTDGSVSAATRTVSISGVAGDLWLGVVHIRVGSSTISAPTASGEAWTEVFSIQNADNAGFKLAAWWKYLVGAESNPEFNATNSDEWGAYVFVFKGAHATTPIDTEFATSNVGNDTAAPASPTVTTAGANRTIVSMVVGASSISNAGLNAPPNGYRQRYRAQLVGAENAQTFGLATREQAQAGATGAITWPTLMVAAQDCNRATIAIRAA